MKSSLSYSILENITEDIYWRGFDYFKKHKVGEIKESDKNLISFVHGSDGVWEIPQARLPLMFSLLKEKGLSKDEPTELRDYFNKIIDGWGDIFEDIGIQLK